MSNAPNRPDWPRWFLLVLGLAFLGIYGYVSRSPLPRALGTALDRIDDLRGERTPIRPAKSLQRNALFHLGLTHYLAGACASDSGGHPVDGIGGGFWTVTVV